MQWAQARGSRVMCDTVVMGENAALGFPFPKVGLAPDFAIAYTLSRRIGVARAKQALLYARTYKGADAMALGLADDVVADDLIAKKAMERAMELAALPSPCVGTDEAHDGAVRRPAFGTRIRGDGAGAVLRHQRFPRRRRCLSRKAQARLRRNRAMSSAGSGMLAVPQTLADMLAKNAWKYPDQTAFVWGDRRVTHAEHHLKAAKLAHALRALGMRRQDRVGMLSQNSPRVPGGLQRLRDFGL